MQRNQNEKKKSTLFARLSKIADFGIWLMGPLCILLAVILITGIGIVHLVGIIPYYSNPSSLLGRLHQFWSFFVLSNIGFNYFMVIRTPPGNTKNLDQNYTEEELMDLASESAPQKGQGFSRFCKTCRIPKPPRAHHCHVCKTCVLRMDHHCPWIGGCVGMNNHKYFFLFMFWLWIGCIWVAVFSLIPLIEGDIQLPIDDQLMVKSVMLMTFALTISITGALGMLMFWHLYLIGTNQTTIEFYFNNHMKGLYKTRNMVWQNEYDMGWSKNWRMFFGTFEENRHPWLWMLPSTLSPSQWGMDGVRFPTQNEDFLGNSVNSDHLV
eukprot:TRINITY_DN3885_c1_g1_i1.p2 TRINITY_DN3885_c1_g1~~TRINITY_DN3885_c1_g1_i1.p2  ORF type:complete len:323 (+),score=68.49 TRINITY_DN3885_c1_g1_i1:213-1181(+)